MNAQAQVEHKPDYQFVEFCGNLGEVNKDTQVIHLEIKGKVAFRKNGNRWVAKVDINDPVIANQMGDLNNKRDSILSSRYLFLIDNKHKDSQEIFDTHDEDEILDLVRRSKNIGFINALKDKANEDGRQVIYETATIRIKSLEEQYGLDEKPDLKVLPKEEVKTESAPVQAKPKKSSRKVEKVVEEEDEDESERVV